MVDQTPVRVFWPFPVNWAQPYNVAYEFRTDIITVETGQEQRRALRITPRKTLSFSVSASHAELRSLNRQLDTAQNLPFILPEIPRGITFSGSGVTMSLSSTAPAWLVADTEVVLWSSANGGRVALVSAVTGGSTLTLTTDEGDWAAGSILYPAITGQLSPELQSRRVTNAVATLAVEFSVDPTSERYAPTSPGATYAGREVYPFPVNWGSGIGANYQWPVETTDFGRGRIAIHRTIDFQRMTRTLDHLFDSVAAAQALVDLFVRMRGRCGSFYVSTFEADMELVGNLQHNATVLRVAGTDVRLGYASDPVRKSIAIKLTDGTTLYRDVTGMVDVTGDRTDVNVDTPWPRTILSTEVSLISWIINTRFATDQLEMEWVTNTVAQSRLTIQSTLDIGGDYLGQRATLNNDDRETLTGDDRVIVYL